MKTSEKASAALATACAQYPWLDERRECDRCKFALNVMREMALSLPLLRRAATMKMTREETALVNDSDLWQVALLCRDCAMKVTEENVADGRRPYGPGDHPMNWAARHFAWVEDPQRARARDVLTATAAACNKRGVTFIGQETLADDYCLPPTTVRNQQQALKKLGLLHVDRRLHRVDGTHGTNVTTLVGFPGLTLVGYSYPERCLEEQVWAASGLRRTPTPTESSDDDIPF